MHYGEGAYDETEREIQALLGVEREPLRAAAPRGRARARCSPPQTADQPGAYSGPYEAGGVWAVLEGAGEVRVNGRAIAVDEPGLLRARRARRATRRGELELEVGAGVDRATPPASRRAWPELRVPAVAEQADEPRRAARPRRSTAVPGQ